MQLLTEHSPGIWRVVSWICLVKIDERRKRIIIFLSDHSREDFQHNNPILSKKHSGGKHRKTSDDKTGKSIKKASTVSALQGIPESQILEDEKLDKTEGKYFYYFI